MKIKKYVNLFAVLLILLTSGCATVDISNVGQDGYKIEDDELRMQKRADEICEMLDGNDYLYRDANLENYLNTLANKLLPETISRQNVKIDVKILKNPALNAFALPNGKIYIHTGIL